MGSRPLGNMELLPLTLSFPCNRKRYQWGEIDTTKQFQPLIEPQPIAQSKAICGKLKYKHKYLKNICLDRRPTAIKKMSSVKIKLT